MSRIYLDTCCIIYLIEAASPFHGVVVARVLRERSAPAARLLTSRLSRLECRTKPLQGGDRALLGRYDEFFAQAGLDVIGVSDEIVERATELRAKYGLKTPDALHLATALEQASDVFLTGDAALARCGEVNVEVLRLPPSS